MNINKSEFLGLVRAESAARKSTAVLAEKENLRNEIQSGIEEFFGKWWADYYAQRHRD